MKYRVIVQPRAEDDIDQAYRWLADHSLERAAKWYNGLLTAVQSLERLPQRCALAPESAWFGQDIRQLLYGKRRGVYRILFVVQGDVVSVLTVRHGARRLLGPDDLPEA